MKLLYTLIILFAFSFAEDVYPHFSDPSQQFEFEEKKIYINEVDEKEMIISGGSQFNYMSLIDSHQPIIVPAPLKTNYNYTYRVEIKQNNKLLSEFDFLSVIGLNKKAEELLNIQEINHNPIKYVNSNLINLKLSSISPSPNVEFDDDAKKISYNNSKKERVTIIPDNYKVFKRNYNRYKISGNVFVASMGMTLLAGMVYGSQGWSFDFGIGTCFGIMGLSLRSLTHYWWKKYDVGIEIPFTYKQQLSKDQLLGLAESYNKKLYIQIQSQP